MDTIKPLLVTLAIAIAAIALVFRVETVRKIVLGN